MPSGDELFEQGSQTMSPSQHVETIRDWYLENVFPKQSAKFQELLVAWSKEHEELRTYQLFQIAIGGTPNPDAPMDTENGDIYLAIQKMNREAKSA